MRKDDLQRRPVAKSRQLPVVCAAVHAHAQVHDLTSTPSLCFTRLSSSLLALGLQPTIISRVVSINSFAN